MSQMAIRFSRALEQGRKRPPPPPTREAVLVSLLNKRATARAVGAQEMEQLLRDQILWSLPTYSTIELRKRIAAT